jgi:Tol biopolymer transport system component
MILLRGWPRSTPRVVRAVVVCCTVLVVFLVSSPTLAAAAAPCLEAGVSPFEHPALSRDGSRVVFTTNASLVPEDTNRTLDVYVQEVETGEAPDRQRSRGPRPHGGVELVSISPHGDAGDGRSYAPDISADGRFVAFQSESTDLVAGDDAAGVTDVFVRDLATGRTELVSVAADGSVAGGASGAPSISPDGSQIAFESVAADLVDGDRNEASDVFVRDRRTGRTRRVSVATDGTEGDGGSFDPSISGTGRVAFHSRASNWMEPNWGPRSELKNSAFFPRDVFVHDLNDGTTTPVSVTPEGQASDGLSLTPSISADGRYVAFSSSSTDLVEGDTNNSPDLRGFYEPDVFVRDLTTSTTQRVSVASDGSQADGPGSAGATTSGDGRVVAFESAATNLDTGDANDALDVFSHALPSGATSRASTTADGDDPGSSGPLSFGSVSPSLSTDGSRVAFVSSAPALVGAERASDATPHLFGVFVRSLGDGSVEGPLGIGCRSADAVPTEGRGTARTPAAGGGGAVNAAATGAASELTTTGGGSAVVLLGLGLLGAAVALRRKRTTAIVLSGLLGVTVVVGAPVVPASAHHYSPIQPGAALLEEGPTGTASLNFVFRDPTTGDLYVGTAAHAVRPFSLGSRMSNDALGEYGTLVYSREGIFDFSKQDFALIRIDRDKHRFVDPAVRHWGGPTAVAPATHLTPGLPVFQYGQAAFLRHTQPTRTKPGIYQKTILDDFGFIGWYLESRHGYGGDSGSPVLYGPDGQALGVDILAGAVLFAEPGVGMGPTAELILQELHLAGFDVELLTAPFHGASGDPRTAEHCAAQPIEDSGQNEGCVRPRVGP